LQIALFIFYLVLFSFLVVKISFFKNSGINKWILISLFILKILFGIAYAQFYLLPKYFDGADTWRFFRLSLAETDWLMKNPYAFAKDLFIHGYDESGNVFAGENSYWNDLKSNVPIKLMAVMNVFTFKNYYTNIILFNFLFLFGLVGLYRVFANIFPVNKWVIIVCVFLFPSTLFWCSGIHKDGLILSLIGSIVFLFYTGLRDKFSMQKVVGIAFCLFSLFALRNYLALALLPALFCWFISTRHPSKTTFIYLSVFITGLVLFFIIPLVFPALNFPLYLAHKQHEFLLLEGGSQIALPLLQPNFFSFLRYLPNALDMALLQPHITNLSSLAFLPAVFENYALLLLILLLIYMVLKHKTLPVDMWFFIFFSGTILLIAGYTITISGAIVRYRSIIFPLLATPILGTFLSRKNLN
jgi:hypothetical protein